MSTHRHINKICCAILAIVLILTVLFMNAGKLGVLSAGASLGYDTRLFDSSAVHTIDIVMDDWDSFLETCENEEYTICSVVIDNEAYKNVGIRAKGNTSLSQVAAYGNDRYSFKIEFDQYDETKNYYGLDKISLNNIIQDNTYMKDFLSYQMMNYNGVCSSLCSYVYITVNGEDWGLYLAVEGVEESFLERNYGNSYGELYKPDSMSMGGGRGNGGGFEMEDFMPDEEDMPEKGELPDGEDRPEKGGIPEGGDMPGMGELPDGGDMPGMRELPDSQSTPEMGELPDSQDSPQMGEAPDGQNAPEINGMPNGGAMPANGVGDGMGSDDVSLIYTDDEYDSYSNIFDNAKTDITDADKDRLIAALKSLNEGLDIEDTVNVEEVIRYFVVHNFVCNFDSYTGSMIHNYYLYEEDGQLSMIPWDYNLAFGGFMSGTDATSLVNYPIDTPVSGGTVDSRPMLAWIFSEEKYTQLYHQYFSEFISSYFDSGYFEEMIDNVSKMIAPYVEKDPTKFCSYEEFEQGVSTLKEFCLLRAESINGQLDGTIPSTSDGQSEDGDTLIDASSITISDMGTMNNGGMGKNRENLPDESVLNTVESTVDNAENARGFTGSKMVNSPDNSGGASRMAAGTSDSQFQNGSSAVLLLAISGGILLAGLIFAFLFNRRK